MFRKFFYIAILLVFPFIITKGQVTAKKRLIQVTGIISDEENNPVPGVSIISQKLRNSTISELSGIYNIISMAGDSISFKALGYKETAILIPGDLSSRQFTKDVMMKNDTIVIKAVVIFPWKNYEEFKRAVLSQNNSKPEISNMYDNLASIEYSLLNTTNYMVSPEAGYRMAMQQNANALYTKGQSPVNNLLNPFAWAKFINGIKNGLFKNQKSTQDEYYQAKVKKKKNNKNKDKKPDQDQDENKSDKDQDDL